MLFRKPDRFPDNTPADECSGTAATTRPGGLLTTLCLVVAMLVTGTTNADTADEPSSAATLSDDEVQALFEQAMAERDSGAVFSAIRKFEYLLDRRPSLNRARLELAVSYHRAARYEDAKRAMQSVLDNPETPESVRLSILAYLAQLGSDERQPEARHETSYYTRFGVLHNSNINFAPLRGSNIYNIPDNQDIASYGLDTFLSASHRYIRKSPLDVLGLAATPEWRSQVSWTGNNYTHNSDFNLNILSVSTGPALVSNNNGRASLLLQYDLAYFGNHQLGRFLSINPLLTLDIGEDRELSFEAGYTRNRFVQSADLPRDGSTRLLGLSYSLTFAGNQHGLNTGIRATRQNANDAQYGFNSTEVYGGGFYSLNRENSLSLNLHFQTFRFHAADSVSGSVRDELETRFTLGYNHEFTTPFLQHWILNTYLSRTKNNSNVDAFSYERLTIGVNLARFFQ